MKLIIEYTRPHLNLSPFWAGQGSFRCAFQGDVKMQFFLFRAGFLPSLYSFPSVVSITTTHRLCFTICVLILRRSIFAISKSLLIICRPFEPLPSSLTMTIRNVLRVTCRAFLGPPVSAFQGPPAAGFREISATCFLAVLAGCCWEFLPYFQRDSRKEPPRAASYNSCLVPVFEANGAHKRFWKVSVKSIRGHP